MPDLDKNYLAGLYLDEITLDVMPQEYIDAALEVKLRHDACAPRAGYVCVQDRRVKGGFYYRKAPQGQGVNALPPSKLERALARSQEQPRPRTEMGFLSKAAIGTGVAIGGLALTGAVINAGRSSEPYQEPPRRVQPPTNNNAAKVGLGVAAATATTAATVFGRRGGSEAEVQSTKTQPEELQPIVNQQTETVAATKPQKTTKTRTPEEQAGFEAQSARNKALSEELSSVGYLSQKEGYEGALRKQLKAKGELPDDIERKVKNLEFEGEDEGFVRIEDVRAQIGGRITKNVRDRQSQKLQGLYDKLKEFGLEGAIEFRGARNKGSGTPAPSADKYSIDLGQGLVQVGEMRFKKTQAQLQEAIAERLKNPEAKSQPPTKAAKPKQEVPAVEVNPVGDRSRRTLVDELSAKLSRAISEDGFAAQSGLISELRKKPQYKEVDLDQEIEDLANNSNGRIQLATDKYGKTLVRDLDQVKVSKLVTEASNIKDPESGRVDLLRNALEYKRNRPEGTLSEQEKAELSQLEVAIAGIGSKESREQKTPVKKPKNPAQDPAPIESQVGEVEGSQPKPKSKKELAREEAARISKINEDIANVTATAVLRNTKKFPQSDQEVFADKATPEQKAKLANVIEREIDLLGESASEREDLVNLYESMIGKKYTPKQAESKTVANKDQSPTPEAPKVQPPAPASNPTGSPSAPPTDTAKQETTRSQPTTPPTENPPASTKKRSRSSKSANTATSTANPSTDREQAAKLTVSRIKAILEAQGITIPKRAKKDQLLDLLVPNSKSEQNNDAIAPSEAYLSAYWEIRNKYRRAS